MEQFKIKQDGIKELTKTFLRVRISMTLFPILVVIIVNTLVLNKQQVDFVVLFVVILLLLAYMSIGIYRGIKRHKVILDSYVLTIDNSGITRQLYNTPVLTIPTGELREIVKKSDGSFLVKGKSRVDVIGIPAQIEQYERIEALLAERMSLSTKTNKFFLRGVHGDFLVVLIA